MTKIVFMGAPAFSVPILESLIEAGYDAQTVVTQPDRPIGRRKMVTPTPVKKAALKHNLLTLQPERISGSPEMEKAIDLTPNVTMTATSGQFLPGRVLKTPRLGAINVRASLLPKYCGSASVYYSIIEGEEEAGVMIMEMVKKMNIGTILS